MGDYPVVILQAFILFPIVAFLFTLPYVVLNYHKYGSVLSLRIIIVYSFILYLMCIYFLVILPLPSIAEVSAMTGARMQLVPFKFVGDILRRAHIVPSQPRTYTGIFNPAFFQFLFNVIMTVPFGIYLRYYFKCRFLKTLILSFCLSLFFELTQLSGLYFIYPRSYRLFDVDDLLANTLGGVFGYAIISPFLKILPSRERIDKVSFHRGRQVSLTRRLISAMFDLIVVALLGGLASTFLRIFHLDIPHFGAMVLFLYFSLVPMVFKGRTFGKFITKTRIASFKNVRTRWYQYPLRVGSFLLVMYVIPWLFYRILIPWLDRRSAAAAGLALLSLMVSGIYFFYLFFAAIMAVLHKRLFYEKISGTHIVSTIAKL